jgi:crotonobetaine/carnitine-CoA ligase
LHINISINERDAVLPVDSAAAGPLGEMPWGASDLPIGELLARRAATDATFPYCVVGERTVTVGELDKLSNRIANALTAAGLQRGDRIATMLANSVEHMALFFAMSKLGVIQVPVNLHLRGEGLAYIISNADCACVIGEGDLADLLLPIVAQHKIPRVFWHTPKSSEKRRDLASLIQWPDDSPPAERVAPVDTIYICYTSGTTGLPKGVMMTDRMLRVAAWAAGRVCDLRDGDILHMWEPFYHIGGCEVLLVAVQHRITIGLVPKFSVSRFWSEVRELGATHIHFLGGVLALLLKEPPSPRDREHNVRVAWGGGCPDPVWRAFEERFGIPIRECYGMTECASFATQNLTGKIGSVGKALPYFDVTIMNEAGKEVGPGERGEIWIREHVPGIITKGYWRNPKATAAALENGVLRTGDLGMKDAEGDYVYFGRKKDSLRRRGENIAAFEVERIINQHPLVEESAIVGVANELADEDIKAFIRPKSGSQLAPLDLIRWCEGRMAYFQIPRFIAMIDEFPRTPSLRIRKELLPRTTDDCWDLEKSGHTLRR